MRVDPQPPEIIEALRAAGCGIRRPAIAPPPVKSTPEPLPIPRTRNLTTIRSVVAAFCQISVNELISERRRKETCRARHIFYAVARELTGASLPKIGHACGNRDHSTVLHGIQKVEHDRGSFEPELSKVLNYLKRRG